MLGLHHYKQTICILDFYFCVGATLDLLRNGHNATAIKRAGGRKSLEVLARHLEGRGIICAALLAEGGATKFF